MQSQTLPEAWSDSTHLLAERLLIKNWPTGLPWQAIAPEALASESHLLPAILRLDQLDISQEVWVRQHLASDGVSKVAPAMLLSSTLSADALARKLARYVTVTLTDDTRALLRFADPEVFMHLLWIFPLSYLAAMCEGTSRWSVPFQGKWHELEFNDRPEPVWNTLSEASSIALANLGLVHETMTALPEPSGVNAFWHLGQQINEWLVVAQTEFALTNAADCAAFARHGALLGHDFISHPMLASHLQAASKTPGRYAIGTASLSERDWSQIVAAIDQTNRKRAIS